MFDLLHSHIQQLLTLWFITMLGITTHPETTLTTRKFIQGCNIALIIFVIAIIYVE